jgi:hypothetical protein
VSGRLVAARQTQTPLYVLVDDVPAASLISDHADLYGTGR